jgi:hypothetical protein
VPVPVKKLDPEFVFQLLQLPGNRRLCETEGLGRLREAEGFGEAQKGFERIEIHLEADLPLFLVIRK